MQLLHLLWLWLGLVHPLRVCASPLAGHAQAEGGEITTIATTVTINDKIITLGEQINNFEWQCTYTVGTDPTVLSGRVKFYDSPNEPTWTSEASAAFDDYLYIDHTTPWLLFNHIPGNTTVGTPVDPNCGMIYESARNEALAFQIQLYQKTGFFQNSPDPANYVFAHNFSNCRIVNFEQVFEFEGWQPNRAMAYIAASVSKIFDPKLHCTPSGRFMNLVEWLFGFLW